MSSRPIDEKIAKLSLDSAQFEKNASNAMKTFSDMNKAFSKSSSVDLSHLEKAVDSISGRFTLLGNIGQAAFQRIANTVLNLGSQLNSVFGIGGAMAGFAEYELKLGSIQTIMVNTGESIDTVSAALDELNTYADQTIYSFSDMTRNIGLFTAAGVDLQTSVSSIKGLANLAAGMGVSNEAAARATWQLSQALGSGYVRLQDWMSVENAGLGGTYFQKALVEHANEIGALGLSYDELKAKYGSFRNSLTEGQWLTNDVLASTLEDFANDQTLQDAATKVKSFSQLVDTVRESVGSGWAQTWEILFGNLEEAKEFWTPISDAITGFVTESNDARNAFIQEWKDLGGFESTVNGIKNIFTGLSKLFKPIKDGFSSLFSGLTPQKLADIAKGFEDITAKFANADFSNFGALVSGAFDILGSAVSAATKGLSGFWDILSKVKDVVVQVAGYISGKLGTALQWIADNVGAGDIFAGLAGAGILGLASKLGGLASTIKDFIDQLTGNGEKMKNAKDNVTELLDSVGESLNAFTTGIKAGTLLTIAAAVGILTLSIAKLSELNGGAVVGSLGAIGVMLGELTAAFALIQLAVKKMDTKGILKAGVAIIAIASAVNILADAIKTISDIDQEDISRGLIGVGVGLAELIAALKLLNGSKVSLSTSVAIIAVAEACKMLADAVESFSGMSWDELTRGLTGMGIALAEVVAAVAILGKAGGFSSLLGGGAILIAVQSLDEIAQALKDIGSLEWESIGKGLAGMGGALAEIAIVVGLLGKLSGMSGIAGAASILIAVQALEPISKSLATIGSLQWETIGKGLAGMGGALAEVAIIAGALGSLSGVSGLLGAGTILLAVQALEPIGDALLNIGALSWETIGKGLIGMGGALAELAIVSGLLGNLSGMSGLLGAGALVIAVQSLEPIADALMSIGMLSWEEIAKGLVGMGGALTELGVVSGVLGTLAGPMALIGSGSLLLAVQGLDDLANALAKFGEMDWDSIGRGLTAMGAAMGETALGGLLNTLSGFGAGAIATMAPALGELADSLKKWKDVSVPEGLGDQLGILAQGVMQFTLGGWGADTLSSVSKPLGTLATSVSKWKDVTIPENIGTDLGKLADGVKAFTLGGWGADTLSSVAKPIGTLATSLKKWDGINVPANIEQILTGLANGIKSFTTAFVGGWSLDSVIGPLGNLAGEIKKWSGVVIPEGIGAGLLGMALGVKAFSGIELQNFESLESLGPAVQQIATAVQGIIGIDFATAAANITSFITALNAIPGQISALGTSMVGAAQTALASLSASFTVGLASVSATSIATLTAMFASINSLIVSRGASIAVTFMQNGMKWMQQLVQGINLEKQNVVSACEEVMNSASDSVSGYYDDFYSAGTDAMAGLADGISAGGSGAISAAATVAAEALAAAKRELDINSPSRKFAEVGMYSDEGLASGFLHYAKRVYNAASSVATNALTTMQERLNTVSQLSMTPKIVPIMDDSGIQKLQDLNYSYDLQSLLKDKLNPKDTELYMKIVNLLQSMNNKFGSLEEKLENIKLYLHLEPQELDGEVITDAVDEIHSIRELLDNAGKGIK